MLVLEVVGLFVVAVAFLVLVFLHGLLEVVLHVLELFQPVVLLLEEDVEVESAVAVLGFGLRVVRELILVRKGRVHEAGVVRRIEIMLSGFGALQALLYAIVLRQSYLHIMYGF